MSKRFVAIKGRATRWLGDEPNPGIVEVEIVDAFGRVWTFVDKAPIFDEDAHLTRMASYPIPILLECLIVDSSDGLLTVSTVEPHGLETVDGVSQFVVSNDQVANPRST